MTFLPSYGSNQEKQATDKYSPYDQNKSYTLFVYNLKLGIHIHINRAVELL